MKSDFSELGSAEIFSKGPDTKSVRFCGPYGLCGNSSTLSEHRAGEGGRGGDRGSGGCGGQP